jgi:hypothetical protein
MSYEQGYNWKRLAIHVDTVVGDSDAIDMRGVRDAVVYVAAGSSVTSLTAHAAPDHESSDLDAYEPLYDVSGAVAITVAADRAYRLPDTFYGIRSLKFVSNADGTIIMSFMY